MSHSPHHPKTMAHRQTRVLTKYHNNERTSHEACPHLQFLDKDFPNTGVCLDCGHEIYLGHSDLALAAHADPWASVPGGVLLTDAELKAHRDRFHSIWWAVS